jgi:hypothetical protein
MGNMGRLTPRVMKSGRRMVVACILMFVVDRFWLDCWFVVMALVVDVLAWNIRGLLDVECVGGMEEVGHDIIIEIFVQFMAI